ncbi:GntR family transcriptional regulator [Streptomyces poonensis]|uniref:HTH gntR-type domain-containing protein n=1 Tax=Streptomyces poonensis TaxID=68255 RepID=A0A918UE18_9ACTN|nr:winged helix-turn-helix domain-containing protein [Streptomyces poonensis]GGY93741.1 hypothetical protein GCM10010365_10480 [Streptomyces poonensis]GLJ87512.1 hypothetical protein GCM10017589_01120 [Streptomyces poonensis]
MSNGIDPTNPAYHYEQLADLLAAKIENGAWPPGTRLPGEMTIAQEYGVGSQTVRRALAILRDRGKVVTVPARGSFVPRQSAGAADG